jgi:hypothetical protein
MVDWLCLDLWQTAHHGEAEQSFLPHYKDMREESRVSQIPFKGTVTDPMTWRPPTRFHLFKFPLPNSTKLGTKPLTHGPLGEHCRSKV